MSKMESSIEPVTNQSSSKTEEDRLMMAKDDIETYSSKADENNYEMNIEEKVNCSNKKLCLHCLQCCIISSCTDDFVYFCNLSLRKHKKK